MPNMTRLQLGDSLQFVSLSHNSIVWSNFIYINYKNKNYMILFLLPVEGYFKNRSCVLHLISMLLLLSLGR